MFELINQDEADRIKEILELECLYKPIEIEVDEYKLNVDNVSETNETTHHQPYKMKEFFLLNNDCNDGVLKYKHRLYEMFVNVGEWGYETRLKNTHITLGSDRFHDFCFQIELSQAIKDENSIYITKNVTSMAGPGAICRLYRGLKNNKIKKVMRQKQFIESFGNEIIKYKNKDWIVISKIGLNDLHEKEKAPEIFYNLIKNMFFAMLLVETIGENDAT
ncbi:hypothetical protein [Clostridium manihotivorum]|uniref:Uncharacterized protein n=1 Tax=Clostridium manihotivorum TaxID=2320868 RepID=A0A410DWU1_9CLOT|nr:hypothetical protein [Clostridium manihotivorum]QAA33545.1 hypothetical protein C1I91_18905 [Clostridium manihotivorum]